MYQNQYVLIADANNHCIRRLDLHFNIITTIAGNGEPGYVDEKTVISHIRLNIPADMAVWDQDLYIVDYGNNAIRKVKLL